MEEDKLTAGFARRRAEAPRLVRLQHHPDERGNLAIIEGGKEVPFRIRRVHWIYDVPGGEGRGGVLYKETKELIVAVSGSFRVVAEDEGGVYTFHLNHANEGVYVPEGYWRRIEDFSTNAIALIAASTLYDAADEVRRRHQEGDEA